MPWIEQRNMPGVNRVRLQPHHAHRPPHPHRRSTLPTPSTPLFWRGISFDKWGGLKRGHYSDDLHQPFPWKLSLFNATITRYYLGKALAAKSFTPRKLADKTGLPEHVVNDILTYGYGWLPDMRKVLDTLQIIPILLPPEITWMTEGKRNSTPLPKRHGREQA